MMGRRKRDQGKLFYEFRLEYRQQRHGEVVTMTAEGCGFK